MDRAIVLFLEFLSEVLPRDLLERVYEIHKQIILVLKANRKDVKNNVILAFSTHANSAE